MKSNFEIYKNAKKLHKEGRLVEALNIYLNLVQTDQNDFELYFLIGTIFLQINNLDKSIEYLTKSINLNFKFSNSFNNRGIAHAKKSEYLNAIKDYDEAIKLNPSNFDANLNKAIALKNVKKYDESLKLFFNKSPLFNKPSIKFLFKCMHLS